MRGYTGATKVPYSGTVGGVKGGKGGKVGKGREGFCDIVFCFRLDWNAGWKGLAWGLRRCLYHDTRYLMVQHRPLEWTVQNRHRTSLLSFHTQSQAGYSSFRVTYLGHIFQLSPLSPAGGRMGPTLPLPCIAIESGGQISCYVGFSPGSVHPRL